MRCWALKHVFAICAGYHRLNFSWGLHVLGQTWARSWCVPPSYAREPRYPGDSRECKVDW